jgi:CheY-like chemotaxis protein
VKTSLTGVPIIALTAHVSGDKERGTATGFTSYLAKPISLSPLLPNLLERVPSLALQP